MSILTYKIKHEKSFATELQKARKVAKYAIKHKSCRSTKDVKHIGLKACIANQVLKKYGGNRKAKGVKSVKLTINGYFVNVDREKREICIPSVDLKLNYQFPNTFTKVKQVELDNKYVYVSVETPDKAQEKVTQFLGVDRNTTGHCAVIAIPHTGKVYKLGKKAFHIHRKYKKIRQHLQVANAKKMLKKVSKREKNIIKDTNHKVARKIVNLAIENKCGIVLENLKGIRNSKGAKSKKKNKNGESFKSSINTWEFYMLQCMIEYIARICGVPVYYIAPQYTSQKCSRCGLIGKREGKKFTCPSCGHVDHADSNAAFNIAALEFTTQSTESNDQLLTDRDVSKGSTDTPQLETQLSFCESKMEVA